MATREQLQSMMRAQPFRPFLVKLASDRTFVVKHPDYASYGPSPRGHEMTVHDDEGVHLVDMVLVEVLEPATLPAQPGPEGNGA
jgi:hypothetical protein